jgi:hypothetical protein
MVTDDASDAAEVEDVPAPRTRRRRKAFQPTSLGRLVANPLVRAGLIVLGTAALAALAAAAIGPKRMKREVYRPLRDAVEPQVDRIASEASALRDQITELFEKTAPEKWRELARNFQSWIGHFRAG